jgi:hypothetical protein
MVMHQQKEATANQYGPGLSTLSSAHRTGEPSASTTTLWAPGDVPSRNVNVPTFAHSAVPKITTLSHGLAASDHIPKLNPNKAFLSITSPIILHYRDFSDTIIHRPIPIMNSNLYNDIYNRIIQPYNANAFETLLSHHDMTHLYPILTTNLREGFPLGEMPALIETVILKNHPSTLQYPDTVKEYLADEIQAGRMMGPFARTEVEQILRGPFFSSPLIVSVQPQGLGMANKLRVCRHLSKANRKTASVNSHVKKEDFPTRFDTASRVADTVSFSSSVSFEHTSIGSHLSKGTSGTLAPGLLLADRAYLSSNRVYFW